MKHWLTYLICLVALPAAAATHSVKVYINSGTGFIVSKEGFVITNKHVVENCKQIFVTGAVSQRPAEVIGSSRTYDLALLKIDGSSGDIAVLRSDSQPIEAGEGVVIVGYPGEAAREGHTVTREAKILNPKGPQGEDKWIEMDDVIEHGNSGGAVLDTSGNVVGVVAAKATIYTYPVNDPRNGTTRNSGIAVSLPTLKDFLSRYSVRYRESESSGGYSADRVTDIAERFIVNVRCAYRTEVR